jgi:hypothetical protein
MFLDEIIDEIIAFFYDYEIVEERIVTAIW